MKVRVIGGGPAGLFFAYLMAREDAGHDVRVYERDPEGATYGWGLVFSDVALSFVRDIAPELYESMSRDQVVFDAMAIVHNGQHVTLAGNTFHRMARIDLLRALHRQCREAGVRLEFERRCDDVTELDDCDLIVAADGARSAIRTRYRDRFEPTLDERPNLLAWYGTTRLFEPLSLIFRQKQDGLIIAHCYQYSQTHSTFLVEVPPETFHESGLDRMSEEESLSYCEAAFAEDLDGHPLQSNRSTWFRYTIVKNAHWYFDNVVLIGDALRTGHPSIGSGTRLALQDSIALFEACQTCAGNVPDALEEFRRIRRPGSDSLQQAAIKSTEWYENLGEKLHLDPISFAYDYLRRNGRVSHAEIRQRDPALADAYEKLHPAVQRSCMSELLFPAPPVAAAPVRGRAERVPIRRIFCVGRNYEAHAKEMGAVVDREAPFYFTKAAEHYVPSGSAVPYPLGTSNYHYEMELVVVIGAPAFRVAAGRALETVFGYACGLDMTRRDLQQTAKEQRRPWDVSKDFEQSAVLAEIVPAEQIGHPREGRIELRVNGETRQSSDISLLIHRVPEVIAHLSTFYHLQAGDLIYTGTPEGVGPVKPGDELAGSIEGIGTIALTIGEPL